MMSMAEAASMPMLSKVLQSVGVELIVFVVSAFLAVSFRDGCLVKPTGSFKSGESLKLKPHRAKQTGSSKPSELLKSKRGGDVALTQSVTHERRQTGFQGPWQEELSQKRQQMLPASSVGSGEELAKTSRQRWKENRDLTRKASALPSGDPIKDALVNKVKSLQASGREGKNVWWSFCESCEGANPNRDPARYPVDVLQQFVESHCLSEGHSESQES